MFLRKNGVFCWPDNNSSKKPRLAPLDTQKNPVVAFSRDTGRTSQKVRFFFGRSFNGLITPQIYCGDNRSRAVTPAGNNVLRHRGAWMGSFQDRAYANSFG